MRHTVRMRLVVSEFISLDGVVQAPGGPEEDTEGGFRHGGWSVPLFDFEAMGPAIDAGMATTEALLFGRRTWKVMADAWVGRAGDEFADQMNDIPKYLASRTLSPAEVGWNTTLLPADDAIGAIAQLKQRDGGDLQVMGSSNLATQLVAAGLVDVLKLMIEPVILGGGKRIFTDNGQASTWKLVDHAVASTGVQICTFEFAANGVGSGSSDEFYE